MSPDDGKDDSTLPAAAAPHPRKSRMEPANLAAAEEADRIPVTRKWGPARTILLIIGVPAVFWALIALFLANR